jgi:sn-glycerol 3-phosphate transport system ATP-binding protein
MAAVTLTDIRKVYAGGVEAVRGVSLEIPDGSFTVLVGPSGCGKSTLLRMVAGLETISAGTIAIGPRVVNDIEPSERDIAMVFQNYALYPHMSVYNNMAYGLRNRRMPKPEIDARVREAARTLGVETYLDRRPRELSGGQRQRVAMGRAIVRRPQVFLFDEPLSNLDAKLRVQMRVEIKRLQRQLGVTSIYVTHDQVEAMTLSDQLVVMSAGKVEQVGMPSELYRYPATRFVAGFIGSPAMNLLPGRIDGPGSVTVGDSRLPVLSDGATLGDAVEVGLRPEDLSPVREDEPGLPLEIDFVEELGATQLIHGRAGAEPVTIQVATGTAPTSGRVKVGIAPRLVHLFDPASQLRLGVRR